jgi:hypothetical protein
MNTLVLLEIGWRTSGTCHPVPQSAHCAALSSFSRPQPVQAFTCTKSPINLITGGKNFVIGN